MKVDRIEGEVANWQEGGLTKREAFAIAAMQAMIPSVQNDSSPLPHQNLVSEYAVWYADALLEELERTEE